MKTAEDLRAQLSDVFAKLRAGEIKPGEASELSNIAGKMIASAKVQVEYYALRKESPNIAFLNSGDQPSSEKPDPSVIAKAPWPKVTRHTLEG